MSKNIFFAVVLFIKSRRNAFELILWPFKAAWKKAFCKITCKMTCRKELESRWVWELNYRKRKKLRRSTRVRHFKHEVQRTGKFYYQKNVIVRTSSEKRQQLLRRKWIKVVEQMSMIAKFLREVCSHFKTLMECVFISFVWVMRNCW